ncbi:MAG: flagellar hook-basal body complex protein FliE [Tissierellia bacterium]|nr:flagellar hook-basal body complex protein FliE [Tissierellia bacterium]
MRVENTGSSRVDMFSENLRRNTVAQDDDSFGSFLNNALDRINEQQLIGDEYQRRLATGDVDNLHDVTIAQEKANVSLQLALGVRNKIIEAYREIMRMQI